MSLLRGAPVLVLTACFGSRETPFEPGLEPLEEIGLTAPAGLEETYVLQSDEGDEFLWGHLRGYVHADLPTVWAAFHDADVVTDRRRARSWSATLDVEPDYDFSMAVDTEIEDTVTVEYVLTWRHGAVGDVEEPSKVSMRWQKTEGFALIDILRGSVALLPTDDPDITEVQMIEHLKAPLTDVDEIENYLVDVYGDAVAHSRGEPLPELQPKG